MSGTPTLVATPDPDPRPLPVLAVGGTYPAPWGIGAFVTVRYITDGVPSSPTSPTANTWWFPTGGAS